MCYITSAMLRVLLLIIATVSWSDATKVAACNYEKVFEHGNIEGKLSLLDWRSFIFMKTQNSISNVFKNEGGMNATCDREFALLRDGIARGETWALKMLDASSKIPLGIMEGNEIDFGKYDQCVNIKGKSRGIEIRGQHCMYTIDWADDKTGRPTHTTLSICMPSTCNGTDVLYLVNNTISGHDRLKKFGISVTSATCMPVIDQIWDTEFTVTLSILMGFVGFLLFCTLADMYFGKVGEHVNPIISTITKFSLIKGVSAIFNLRVREDNILALHGIRCLSMLWVILGHEYVIYLHTESPNALNKKNWLNTWKSLWVYAAPFTVDTFFVISGFLMTYMFLKEMLKKEQSFNILKYYLHRYLRLTPTVVALIIFAIVFEPKIGSGPMWNILLGFGGEPCREKWWTFMLYMQNILNQDNTCLVHLWYIAVDMQLFWISPLILYPLHKKPKLGLAIIYALLIVTIVIPWAVAGLNKYPALIFFEDGNAKLGSQAFKNLYLMPYNRASPWLIGILLGYQVATNNKKLEKPAVYIGWLIATGALVFCICGVRSFLVSDYEYNVVWESTFTAISRPIWAIGISWVVYACLNNHAGPISTFLSHKWFIPLSRLSYSIYLVHMLIQTIHTSALRSPYHFSDFFIWHDFISTLIISIVVGLLFYLLLESPMKILEKMIFKRKSEKVKDS